MTGDKILYVIAVYIVIFLTVQLLQALTYKIKDRNDNYFVNRERSKWKKRLISTIISFTCMCLIIVYMFKTSTGNMVIRNLKLEPGDIFVALSSILIISLAYIYGNRRGEQLSKGLQPIIRENSILSLSEHPYRTIRQSYKFPSYGRRLPSNQELLEWREKSRDYASGTAMWITLYLMYILILIEGIIAIIAIRGGISLNISNSFELFKAIGILLTGGFLLFSILSIIIHIPIIWFIECIAHIFNVNESKASEWTKFVMHSILFNVAIIIFFKLVS